MSKAAPSKPSNTFVVSPDIESRFPIQYARTVLRDALAAAFGGGAQYSAENTKAVAEAIRNTFKGACVCAARGALSRGASVFARESRMDEREAPQSRNFFTVQKQSRFFTPPTELAVPRYKVFVQLTVFEAKQQGVRVASRALWDTTTDFFIAETFSTDALSATATVAAVYTP